MFIEFDRKWLRKDYNDDIQAMKKAGDFVRWTDERIAKAFNFGHGTMKDLKQYMNNNKCYCIFMEV